MKEKVNIFMRYLILLVVGLLGAKVIYPLFIPLTIYPVYSILKVFFETSISGNFLMIQQFLVEITGPCIASSAYYLLLILNLATPNINIKNRFKLAAISFSALLLVNIIRITILTALFVTGFSFFDLLHKAFWYLGSTLFVVGIWFVCVKLFKIKEIPFYSDIKQLVKDAGKKTKKTKQPKRHPK